MRMKLHCSYNHSFTWRGGKSLLLEDTRAVSSAMVHPSRKEPRKMPMKEPMDRNRPATSKWESPPSAVLYSSTDLQRRKRSGALGEYHIVIPNLTVVLPSKYGMCTCVLPKNTKFSRVFNFANFQPFTKIF